MRDVRIGLVGAGLIGGTHSLMLRQIADVFGGPRVRLVAVADPAEEHRLLVEAIYHAARTATEVDVPGFVPQP